MDWMRFRENFRKEVYRDLDKTVKSTVEAQLSLLAKSVQAAAASSPLVLGSAVNAVKDASFMAQAGISDDELDRQVASGGISPNTMTVGGFKKEPATTLLASAKDPGMETAQTSRVGPADVEDITAGAKPRSESIARALQERGSMLLPKGTLQVEPGITYAHFSSNRIKIEGFYILPFFIGVPSTEEVNRDVMIETLSFKYGFLNNLQFDFKVPYRQEFDRVINSGQSSETVRSASGFGDIEMGMSRQIGWEHDMMPDLIANVTLKTPTGQDPYEKPIGLGTGHWAVRTALIAAKSSDPAVIFGSINYTYNVERSNIENVGTVKPGDSVGYSVGTAIALSYQTAVSFSFDQSVNFSMTKNGQRVVDSFLNSSSFKTGFNWALSANQSVDFGVSMGLTKDSPDMTVELRFPHTF